MTEIKINVTVNGEVDIRKFAEQIRKQFEQAIKDESVQAEKSVTAKWATINRKPNEFKKGDIVQLTYSDGRKYFGEIDGKSDKFLTSYYFKGFHYINEAPNRRSTEDPGSLTLVTPVEARFDR